MLKDLIKERLQKYNSKAISIKRIGSTILLFSFITLITIFLKAGSSNEYILIAKITVELTAFELKDLLLLSS
jgi:hypothetical protein